MFVYGPHGRGSETEEESETESDLPPEVLLLVIKRLHLLWIVFKLLITDKLD